MYFIYPWTYISSVICRLDNEIIKFSTLGETIGQQQNGLTSQHNHESDHKYKIADSLGTSKTHIDKNKLTKQHYIKWAVFQSQYRQIYATSLHIKCFFLDACTEGYHNN